MKIVFTDPYVKNLTAVGRYTDASTTGLNLNLKKNGGKYWIFRYSWGGKRVDLSLGVYPEISLKEARKRALASRNSVLNTSTPTAYWKVAVASQELGSKVPKFKDFAKQCIEAKMPEWKNAKHTEQWFRSIEVFANPMIGEMRVDTITTDDVLKVLIPIWHNKTETATRLRGRIEWILAAANTRQLRSGPNPASWRGHLATLLPKPSKITSVVHHPALPYSQIPEFMKELRDSGCMSALALEFLILNGNRTGEVVGGLRSEVNGSGIWIIPAERMKGKREHRIPLGQRALDILAVAKSIDPCSEYLFSINGAPLSNMAMLMFLRGRHEKLTVHGFRSSFRDWAAEETLHSPEVAEKTLAHAIRNQVEAAYRRGDLMEHRKRLMQDWEDYCMTGSWGNVVHLTENLKSA